MRRPFLDNREAQFFAFPRRFAEERNLAGFALARDPRGIAQHGVGGFDKLAAVGRKRIECAGSHKAFKGALIDELWIDTARELANRAERSAFRTRADDVLHRLLANAFHGCERVVDDVLLRVAGEIGFRAVSYTHL